jgi:hypothetical protein
MNFEEKPKNIHKFLLFHMILQIKKKKKIRL